MYTQMYRRETSRGGGTLPEEREKERERERDKERDEVLYIYVLQCITVSMHTYI